MVDAEDKLSYFQAITGLEDPDLCNEILAAHNYDLELAISTFTSDRPYPNTVNASVDRPVHPNAVNGNVSVDRSVHPNPDLNQPGLVWKLVTLPITVISTSLGLISGLFGFGFWAANGVLSYSLRVFGLHAANDVRNNQLASVSEAADFVERFENEYGAVRPNFVRERFNEALMRARNEFKMMFVYIHSPDHQDTGLFCERTLCSEVLVEFLNENFVCWGGSIRGNEGFKMSNSFKVSRFPFCAVAMAATNQRVALLQQAEGPKSPEEMLSLLQRVLEESGSALVSARLEAEERRNTLRLREEQDAAYRAALEADQARERLKIEEEERLGREVAEAERQRKEEEEAQERAAREAAEKEAARSRLRQEKAISVGAEPAKGPNVTQVLVRFPLGERKERRFPSTATIQTLYDFVESLDLIKADDYVLVSNFPRVTFGVEKMPLSLKEAGLHPQASLFVELNS